MSSSSAPPTSYGPLTTIFTPPPDCTKLAFDTGYPPNAYQAQSCKQPSGSSSPYGVENVRTCYPPGPSIPYFPEGYYSPGLACPSGYTTACMQVGGAQPTTAAPSVPSFYFVYPPGISETAVGCCPSQYPYICVQGNGQQQCLNIATNTVLSVYACRNSGTTSPYSVSIPAAVGGSTISSVVVQGPLVQLVYQQSDLNFITVTQPAATVTASPGLDTGEKAGIGVGVVIAVLLAAAVVVGLLILRRRRTSSSRDDLGYGGIKGQASSEVDRGQPSVRELGDSGLNELEDYTSELPAERERFVS